MKTVVWYLIQRSNPSKPSGPFKTRQEAEDLRIALSQWMRDDYFVMAGTA